jgi:ABC-type glycerol-3-phosphate transport system substrate-binding protein
MTGIVYNEDKLNALGKSVPNTTDELIQILKDVKVKNKKVKIKEDFYEKNYRFYVGGYDCFQLSGFDRL